MLRDSETGLWDGFRVLELLQNFLAYGGFPANSRLISLQIFIQAPSPKFTPLGPSMNS